jgi:hypothetical protein
MLRARLVIERSAIGVLMAAAVCVLMPATAQAIPPDREPLGGGDFILTDHCTFDIAVEFVQNREILTTFYDADGTIVRQSVTGTLKVRLTNLKDDTHSRYFNISGPSETRFLPDGSSRLVATGTSIQLFITNMPGQLILVHGRFEGTINDEGFFATSLPPNVQDVCALLS